jgi:hypothetical protein
MFKADPYNCMNPASHPRKREAVLIEPTDPKEFDRLLEEGDLRLRRSREALKSNPRRPTSWEDITPPQLKPAITHLRREFDSGAWQLEQRVECGCYLGLHPELALAPKFKGGFTEFDSAGETCLMAASLRTCQRINDI